MSENSNVAVGPNEAHVAVAHGPLVGAVLGRVVGMLAARAQCPIDKLDDALLITDAVAAHAPRFSADDRVRVVVRTNDSALEIIVGSLAKGGTEGLVADEVDARSAGDGATELVLRLRFNSV